MNKKKYVGLRTSSPNINNGSPPKIYRQPFRMLYCPFLQHLVKINDKTDLKGIKQLFTCNIQQFEIVRDLCRSKYVN